MIGKFPEVLTWTGYFSNLTGSSATNRRFFTDIGPNSPYLTNRNSICIVADTGLDQRGQLVQAFIVGAPHKFENTSLETSLRQKNSGLDM